MSKPDKSPRNKLRKRRFYKRKRLWFALLLLFFIACGIAVKFADDYTREYRLRAETYDLERINDLEVPSIILGSDGEEIGRIFVQNRSIITIDEVPENFIDALRAGEDKRFWDHQGVDYVGIARAARDWYQSGEAVSGASTITQQLARGAFELEAERLRNKETGPERKMVEIFLAMRIEKRYTKKEILEFYLNRIYFGSGFYGLRSAALGYFGKEPKDLNDLECATIVGLIKNPTGLSPLNDIEACKGARNMVIERMKNLDLITAKEAANMSASPITLNPKPLRRGTSHVYERISDEVRGLLGEDAFSSGGYTIQTSIDSKIQEAAESQLEASLKKVEEHPGYSHPKHGEVDKGDPRVKEYLQGAVFMVDHRSGAVIAHVGGRDYAEVPYDVIEFGRRPLGTAFHPILYSTAFEQGMTPATSVQDEALDNRTVMLGAREGIPGEWGMEVSNPRYEGAITLRRALEASKIAASIRVANEIGLDKVVDKTRDFGIELPENVELLPRLAVGWESASLKEAVRAYSAFPRGGSLSPKNVYYVERILSPGGQTMYERNSSDSEPERAIQDATAFQIHSILQGGMERGSAAGLMGQMAEVPFNGAGKPGTTHDFSDNWFLGYNGRVTCGVWVGFLQSGKTIYQGAFAKDHAMPVWLAAMNAASKDYGGRGIPQPSDVVRLDVCRISGERSTPYCYERIQDPGSGKILSRPTIIQEYFRKGTEKLPFCAVHSGSSPAVPDKSTVDIRSLAVIDTSPVKPQKPTLLGDDPYHSVHIDKDNAPKGRVRSGSTNVLDSFDLNDALEGLQLPEPDRLEILPE